jgi:hypothetical protein
MSDVEKVEEAMRVSRANSEAADRLNRLNSSLTSLCGYSVARPTLIAERHEPPKAAESPAPLPKHPAKPPTLWDHVNTFIDALCGIRYDDPRKTSGNSGRGVGQETDARK